MSKLFVSHQRPCGFNLLQFLSTEHACDTWFSLCDKSAGHGTAFVNEKAMFGYTRRICRTFVYPAFRAGAEAADLGAER